MQRCSQRGNLAKKRSGKAHIYKVRKANLKNHVFEDEVVVVVGHSQLDVLQDELVHHDVVPDDGVDQLLVVGSFLVRKYELSIGY